MNEKRAQVIVDPKLLARRIYAGREDFCMIFEEEMNALYSLALLLTADRERAEKCFLVALDDCRNANDVFREWARPWSRRAIIKRAIQQVHPVPDAANAAEASHQTEEVEDIPRRLLQLRPFERFVFAMTVLERYSAWECAALLECQVQDVERARIAALRFLGGSSRDRLTVFGSSGTQRHAESRRPAGIF